MPDPHTTLKEKLNQRLRFYEDLGLGPFYRETTPRLPPGSQIAKKVGPGTECALYGRVTDVNGKPLANATVSVWQTC